MRALTTGGLDFAHADAAISGDAGWGAAPAPVTVVVQPVGRLEGERSVAFRRRLAVLSVVDGADLAVDLGAVPSMDDAAARSLADAASRLSHHAGRLTVRHSRTQPREALGAVGLSDARTSVSARPCSPGSRGGGRGMSEGGRGMSEGGGRA